MIKGQTFSAPRCDPGLYVAATPIGNLADITLRVIETLASCDLIACEDTRVTAKLLRHYGINTKTIAYHEHNADTVGPKLIEKLAGSMAIAVVSDAGTPLISDPGFRLVEATRAAGHRVVPLPGASSPLAALVASGLPATSCTFIGFLPSKQNARRTELKRFHSSQETAIFFESPNRLIRTLSDMHQVYGPDRTICVAREITKLHEEIVTGTVEEVEAVFAGRSVRGEIVILVSPAVGVADLDPETVLAELMKSMSLNQAAAEAAQLTGLSKRELYKLALSVRDQE